MTTTTATTATRQDTAVRYSPDSRQAPWDVMGGHLTTEYPNVQAALEGAGLDYEVQMREVFSTATDGSRLDAPSLRAAVRPMADGTEKVLAVTGKRFTPIHNRDAFGVADLLVAEYGAKISGAADFRNGASSLLVLDLARPVALDRPDGGTDEVNLDLMIRNAHDGSAALTFALVGLRPACTNALQAALRTAKRRWSISHTPNAAARVDLARQSIIAALNYQDEFQQAAQAMMDKAMVDAEFDKIVASLWPVADGKEDTKAGQRRLEIRDEVRAIYQGSPTLEGVRGTRWGGYNAVTEWLDWGREVRGGDVSRAEGALDGPYVRTKGNVWGMFAGAR